MNKPEDHPAGKTAATATAAAPARHAVPPSPIPDDEAARQPDDREERVAELRKQHADGTYNVDAKKVSSKIIDRHLDK